MQTNSPGEKLQGKTKLAVDLGPLIVFMIGYFFSPKLAPIFGRTVCTGEEMYVAISLFIPVFIVAFMYSVWKEKRVAPMLGVTGVLVLVLGGLTLILKDKTFFYMKPTITYLLFGGVLAGGLLAGKNFLKLMFDNAFQMDEAAWRTLTWRFAALYGVMAIANEILWRTLAVDCLPPPGTEAILRDAAGACMASAECAGEKVWVNVKLWGFTAVYFIFIAAHAPFLAKHATMPDQKD